jgi:hypothetical protein
VPDVPIPVVAATVDKETDTESLSHLAAEPWVGRSSEFVAPLPPPDAFPGQTEAGPSTVSSTGPSTPGFLGSAVGSIHESLRFWKEMFEEDIYVEHILKEGYKIPVEMTAEQRAT